MKIVINTIPLLSPITGVGNYIFNVSTQLRHLRSDYNFSYYSGCYSKKMKVNNNENNLFFKTKEIVKRIPIISSIAHNAKNTLTHFQPEKYDLYFEPNHIPLDIKARNTVTTICDFSFIHNPEWHTKSKLEYFSKNFLKKIYYSDVIITISDYVKQEATEILKGYSGTIKNIPLGYDNALFNSQKKRKNEFSLPERFVLFVGSVEPRKNLKRLLNAYILLPNSIKSDCKLLIAGFKGWNNTEIMNLLKKEKKHVEYLGYVNKELLANLYKSALCFVYPSLYEGFGLPPLEAMACGCPVVVSSVASLPEVCGDAACYVDPHNVESISEGMYRVLTDESLRRSLSEKGKKRAKLFSWEKTAKDHIEVFEEIN